MQVSTVIYAFDLYACGEQGAVEFTEPTTKLKLESPAGMIEVTADVDRGRVTGVTFRNIPAFAVHLVEIINVPTLGEITVDVAWTACFKSSHKRRILESN